MQTSLVPGYKYSVISFTDTPNPSQLRGMERSISDAERRAAELVDDLDSVKERDLESAFRIIQESKAKSARAKQQVETVPRIIQESQ